MTSKRPLIIAHRGASAVEPENTLRAFERACILGADGIELDVFLTKDGHVVVTHDQDTQRLTGVRRDVCGSTLRDLRVLNFGKQEKIPLLAEVFENFLKKFSTINIEIKSMGLKNNGIENKVTELIQKFSCREQVLISSFNPLHLYRTRRLMPQVRLGYLLCRYQMPLLRNRFVVTLFQPDTLNLDQNLYHNKKFRAFFNLKFPQWVWTVNLLDQMDFWAHRKKVAAIITNFPDKLREVIVGWQDQLLE